MTTDLHHGFGRLKYEIVPDYGYKLIAEVDNEIIRYYHSLIPKAYGVRLPMYRGHITVVRNKESSPRR